MVVGRRGQNLAQTVRDQLLHGLYCCVQRGHVQSLDHLELLFRRQPVHRLAEVREEIGLRSPIPGELGVYFGENFEQTLEDPDLSRGGLGLRLWVWSEN